MRTISIPIEQLLSIHNAKVYLTKKEIDDNDNYLTKNFLYMLIISTFFLAFGWYFAFTGMYLMSTIGYGYFERYNTEMMETADENYILGDEWDGVINAVT